MIHRRNLVGGLAFATCAPVFRARARAGSTAFIDRLGIASDEIAPDLPAALRFLREFRLRWVELRKVDGKYVTDLDLAACKQMRGLLDKNGIRVCALDTALYKCDLPDHPTGKHQDYAYAEQDGLLGRALERAPVLGTSFIRVFSFWRSGKGDGGKAPLPQVVDHLGRAAERARRAGCTLLVENLDGANVETSAEAARLLAALPARNLGLLWCPNNAFCGGETPFPDGYRALAAHRDRILHVHLRDSGWDPATNRCRWLPVGKGQVDNLGLLRALARDRFAGNLSLQPHYIRPDNNLELSTRESLTGLLQVLAKV